MRPLRMSLEQIFLELIEKEEPAVTSDGEAPVTDATAAEETAHE
jgi:hypothetical protein